MKVLYIFNCIVDTRKVSWKFRYKVSRSKIQLKFHGYTVQIKCVPKYRPIVQI